MAVTYNIIQAGNEQDLITAVNTFITANPTYSAVGGAVPISVSLWIQAVAIETVSIIGAITNDGTFATPANQVLEIARLTSILAELDVALSTRNAEATQLLIKTATDSIKTNTDSSTTSAVTSVVSVAVNATLLALNAARKGATIFNDSTEVLYIKLGTTASLTSYTVQIEPLGYYEVPFKYNGRIDGIWAAANGNARITELS